MLVAFQADWLYLVLNCLLLLVHYVLLLHYVVAFIIFLKCVKDKISGFVSKASPVTLGAGVGGTIHGMPLKMV